uniref:5'-nucleotidase domain-containing protein n=1 Tax=Palpitomonas bilix TaxID=652834 RepID=A0A7S3GA12_9EUKA
MRIALPLFRCSPSLYTHIGLARPLLPSRIAAAAPSTHSHASGRRGIKSKSTSVMQRPKINPNAIFANTEVWLDKIDVYGFDFDYTLGNYTRAMESTIYEMARDILVRDFSYPSVLTTMGYKEDFAIRGLCFDTKKGVLAKINSRYNVELGSAYLGHKKLSAQEVKLLYNGSRRLPSSYVEKYCRISYDTYCLPEATLLCDVVQVMREQNISFDPLMVFKDVRFALNKVHSGATEMQHGDVYGKKSLYKGIHWKVMEEPDKYLEACPRLVEYICRLREHGKKVFILTNSPYQYLDAGMKYILSGDKSKPYTDWRFLFDAVMVSSKKPSFYTSDAPFRSYNVASHSLLWNHVSELTPGNVYAGGSLREFSRLTGWKGSRILYLGDHLYADLKDASQLHSWTTGVVVKELKNDIEVANTLEYRMLVDRVIEVEQSINLELASQTHMTDESLAADEKIIFALAERDELRKSIKKCFSSHFGSPFRTFHNPSMFGFNIQLYADLYTSDVLNFLDYPLSYRFYQKRRFLPHEV